MSEEHEWDDRTRFGFVCCKKCCIIQRADGTNKACRGPNRLRPFEESHSVETFVAERNEMLLACDVDKALAFQAKHSPGVRPPANRLIVEIGLHKARTAATGLPIEARKLSKQWLTERGYKSADDGEL